MSLDAPINLALIGTGNRSQTVYAPLFELLRPWVRLVAVCDPVHKHADAYAEQLNVEAFYSIQDLVEARPMEAALIVAPVDIHHAMACYLMEHGVHCHVETSMCSLLAQAQEMVDTARKQNVVLRIGENFFRFPFDRIAKQIVETGFIGPVHRLTCLHDHTGYHNNSRWIHFYGSHPEAVQAVDHSMPTAPHYEASHRFHTDERFRAHFFWFPEDRLVVDLAANIKGLLGRYPRPGYTEINGARGAIVRQATETSNPQRAWHGVAEVRYCSDAALGSKAIADEIYPVEHIVEDGDWASTRVDLPSGRVEYVNAFRLPPEANNHPSRDYYAAAVMGHVVDFAKAVRRVADSEYDDKDAMAAMMMEVGTRESALRDGQRLSLPLRGELVSEEITRQELQRRHGGVDPMDVEAMLAVSVPRP